MQRPLPMESKVPGCSQGWSPVCALARSIMQRAATPIRLWKSITPSLDWLNQITDSRFNFFGLEVELKVRPFQLLLDRSLFNYNFHYRFFPYILMGCIASSLDSELVLPSKLASLPHSPTHLSIEP